ncbi:MAG: outer membrane beta-barrel protein [Pyrinomonadaceae bacterium]
MRKLVLFFFLIAVCAPEALAQSTDDYNKYDVYLGYSHNRADTGISDGAADPDDIFDEREGFHGFEAAVAGNVRRYVGIKGDYAFHRKSFEIGPSFKASTDFHTLVGGIQLKDNATDTKVKPFAHLMAGLTHARFKAEGIGDFNDSETGFAGVIGGGIDVRINNRVDIRAIQFDYHPTRLGDATQHNFRIGFGVVFR